jgi:hypothetical protein
MASGGVPHSWVGHTIAVALLEPAPASLRFGGMDTDIRLPSTAVKSGTLDAVTDHGIVGAFSAPDADEEPVGFYPWSAVLAIMPEQNGGVAEVRPIG